MKYTEQKGVTLEGHSFTTKWRQFLIEVWYWSHSNHAYYF